MRAGRLGALISHQLKSWWGIASAALLQAAMAVVLFEALQPRVHRRG